MVSPTTAGAMSSLHKAFINWRPVMNALWVLGGIVVLGTITATSGGRWDAPGTRISVS